MGSFNIATMQADKFIQTLFSKRRLTFSSFPDKRKAEALVNGLYDLLFGREIQEDRQALTAHYHIIRTSFREQVLELVQDEETANKHTHTFFERLPAIYEALLMDAEALLQFDPAARSIEEVIVAYPGFFATAVYRMAHQLSKQEIPTLPRLLSEYAHSITGIDIHPGARIGHSFAIDHGTGIVIGETAVIGNRVKIYQGVTLGALHVSKDLALQKRHPTIEDDVIIYSGATILGGNTIVGAGSVLGGNIWLTHSVAPHSVVYHKSEIRIRDKDPFPEAIDFVI